MTDGTALRPHRGTLVLVLGIVGIVCCMPAGIVAWVLGHQDLRDMNAGLMDPTGRGMTQAGKILGMISVALVVVGGIIWMCLLAFGVMAGTHMNT
jgi:uncharacterized protein DUF4190